MADPETRRDDTGLVELLCASKFGSYFNSTERYEKTRVNVLHVDDYKLVVLELYMCG